MKKVFPIIIVSLLLLLLVSCASTGSDGGLVRTGYVQFSIPEGDFSQVGYISPSIRKVDDRKTMSNEDLKQYDGMIAYLDPEPVKARKDSKRFCYILEFEDGSMLFYSCKGQVGDSTEIFREPYIKEVLK